MLDCYLENPFKTLREDESNDQLRKLTQTKLSKDFCEKDTAYYCPSLTRERIAKIETYKADPSFKEIKAYCLRFRTTADYLLNINTSAKYYKDNIDTIGRITSLSFSSIEKISKLSETNKKIFDRIIDSGALNIIIKATIMYFNTIFSSLTVSKHGQKTELDTPEKQSYYKHLSSEYMQTALDIIYNDKVVFDMLNRLNANSLELEFYDCIDLDNWKDLNSFLSSIYKNKNISQTTKDYMVQKIKLTIKKRGG